MSKSILLADDSPTIHRVVEITFADTEFLLATAASGTEALAKLEDVRPDFVLADVVMPEPTGYELCRRIKASARPVPVLLLAGTFEAFDHDAARSCGADGCLLKPFEPRTLLERVATLLASRDAGGLAGVEPVAADLIAAQVADTAVAGPALEADEPDEARSPAEAPAEPPLEPVEKEEQEALADLSPGTIDAIAREVVRRLSENVVREIAREVIPQIAEAVVRERIRELEQEEP